MSLKDSVIFFSRGKREFRIVTGKVGGAHAMVVDEVVPGGTEVHVVACFCSYQKQWRVRTWKMKKYQSLLHEDNQNLMHFLDCIPEARPLAAAIEKWVA